MNATVPDLQSWLAARRREVEVSLERWVPATGRDPEFVWQAMRYSLLAGGKRLRPMLTLAAAQMFGYSGEGHVKLATSVEFMHTATLLHDDVVDE